MFDMGDITIQVENVVGRMRSMSTELHEGVVILGLIMHNSIMKRWILIVDCEGVRFIRIVGEVNDGRLTNAR